MKDLPDPTKPLQLQAIGFLRAPTLLKFDTRHQATNAQPQDSLLELLPEQGYQNALADLQGFTHLWLIWGFHRNQSWRPQVIPPRGPAKRRGLFATRSPHRPNPIGISAVELRHIRGLTLHLGPNDLLDGTPIYDIKPYIPAYDSFPQATQGWLDEADAWAAQDPSYQLAYSDYAQEQAAWLRENWSIDFTPRLEELLTRDPTPHRTRRIQARGDSQFEIGCGAWRAAFEVKDQTVHILALEAGYPLRFLEDPARQNVPDRAAQLAHLSRYPNQPDRAR